MKKVRLSASELKRNTGEILNLVFFGETIAVVERYGEPLVKIIPFKREEREEREDLEEKLKKYFGSIPDFPSVSKSRYFRRRAIRL